MMLITTTYHLKTRASSLFGIHHVQPVQSDAVLAVLGVSVCPPLLPPSASRSRIPEDLISNDFIRRIRDGGPLAQQANRRWH